MDSDLDSVSPKTIPPGPGTMRRSQAPSPSPSGTPSQSDHQGTRWNKQTVVLVGPDEQPFTVHDYALRKIPFFRGCLDAPMVESQQGVIRLPEDDPAAFAHLCHFIYHGRFEPETKTLVEAVRASADNDSDGDSTDLLRLRTLGDEFLGAYFLAKKMLADDMAKCALGNVVSAFRTLHPTSSNLIDICERTQGGDPLRQRFMHELSYLMLSGGGYGWGRFKVKHKDLYENFARVKVEYMEFLLESLAQFPKGR